MQFNFKNKGYLTGVSLIILASLLGAYIPYNMRDLIDSHQAQIDIGMVCVLIGLYILQALLQFVGFYLLRIEGEQFNLNLRHKLTQHLLYAQQSSLDQLNSAETANQIIANTQLIKDYVVGTLPTFLASIVMIGVSMVFLILLDWKLTLALFLTLLVMAGLLIPVSAIGAKYTRQLQDKQASLTGQIGELLYESAYIKGSNGQVSHLQHLKENLDRYRQIALSDAKVSAISTPLGMSIIFVSVAIIFIYGGTRVVAGNLSVGILISFLIYLFQLLNPISALTSFATERAKNKTIVQSLDDLFQSDLEVVEGQSVGDFQQITFEQVHFAYQDQPILKGLDLIFSRHQKIAIVGPSGSGKSTIIKLLQRLYIVTQGSIRVDQFDLASLNLKEWRNQIATVSQGGSIFSGTIKENLLMGFENQDLPNSKIEEVLRAVNLWDEIETMPAKLATHIGEGGKRLSGGQKQRLQIARIMLKTASFVIFDEATANLDPLSESVIAQSIEKMKAFAGVIVIAHRLSTVINADWIYFIEDGQVTGQGKHEDLMVNHRLYQQYVTEQMLKVKA